VFKPILDWLDHRIGIRNMVSMMLLEQVPGGAGWRYVWGSTLVFVFSIQLITGVLLMTAYSPSSTQAWSSVHFIQYKMDFGWLIRGLHHFGSQTMMILIGLHMLQVVIAGAHLPPREVNWWLGMALFGVVFGLSLTGYLLPWDQKGFWATRVATNISNNIPVIGPEIRQLLVGGEDYGNHTLTRFYALHVAILPGSLIALLVLHIIVFRRHGVTSAANIEGIVTKPENEHSPGSEPFWPRQAFYDMVLCMIIFAVMLGLLFFPFKMDGTYHYGHGHAVKVEGQATSPMEYDYWAKAGQRGVGANLDAAADRETANYPARPEWYFLFLFQLLKYFEGEQVLIGTVYIPNGVMLLLTILPLLGYGMFRKFGHAVGILVMVMLLVMVALLTVKAFMDDTPEGLLGGLLKNKEEKAIKDAEKFQKSVEAAEELAQRACQLAMEGTPVEGGHRVIRRDPMITGRKLFEKHCGSCHNFSPHWTGGKSASDLGDFGTQKWVRGLLIDPMSDNYFGLVKKKGEAGNVEPALTGMRGWRKGIDSKREDWNKEKIDKQEKELDVIAQWLVDQENPKLKDGLEFFKKKDNRCASCHAVGKEGSGDSAPDLTLYGSEAWIRAMVMRPGHASRYGEKNLMPAFRPKEGVGTELSLQEFRETNPGTPDNKIFELSDVDRELIIRWLRQDDRLVYGGAPLK
jgi:ubiquinol-cytochrome c reductase cytochrome b subunit